MVDDAEPAPESEPPRGSPVDAPFDYVLRCPCGDVLTGGSEDEIVERSFAHLRAEHPHLADEYERHHILFMATKHRRRPDPSTGSTG